jgi:hypothetical protein
MYVLFLLVSFVLMARFVVGFYLVDDGVEERQQRRALAAYLKEIDRG